MLHLDANGYWRDTLGSRDRKQTATFGHKSKVSKTQATVAWREWIQNHGARPDRRRSSHSLASVCQEYLNFAYIYYRNPDGTPTGEAQNLKFSLQPLTDLFADMPINDLGFRHVDAFVESQIKNKISRNTINKRIGHIKRMLLWAKNKLDCPSYDKVRDYEGLKLGRSEARETEKVKPVPREIVDATLPKMTTAVADMVRIQLLTGMRPEEVCQMAGKMIDRSITPWLYQPDKHKNKWRGKNLRVYFGPLARKILDNYLTLRPFSKNLFTPGNGQKGRWYDYYTTNTYRQAIWAACDRAFPPPTDMEDEKERRQWKLEHRWSPNQLRHTRLTELERIEGADVSRAVAGHAQIETTQGNYIERDSETVSRVMEKLG